MLLTPGIVSLHLGLPAPRHYQPERSRLVIGEGESVFSPNRECVLSLCLTFTAPSGEVAARHAVRVLSSTGCASGSDNQVNEPEHDDGTQPREDGTPHTPVTAELFLGQ